MATRQQTMAWLDQLNTSLPVFLQSLALPNQTGRFLPCLKGLTSLGRKASLGFSCFALKTFYTLGLWDSLTPATQTAWVDFIRGFQVAKGRSDNSFEFPKSFESLSQGAFLDPIVIQDAHNYMRYPSQLLYHMYPYARRPKLALRQIYAPVKLTSRQRVILAETKQAIATLAEVNALPRLPFAGFPTSPDQVRSHLDSLDWSRPWEAGGQAAALIFFLTNEAPRLLNQELTLSLQAECSRYINGLADPVTGSYFKGRSPDYGQAVNGAMKILTGLAWLETPIHYPERLIDTCLERLPRADGCHLVDAIYVLYQCQQQITYKQDKIQNYCWQVLDLIKAHYNSDGGLSYNIGRSQTGYYGALISRGRPVSDLHGTILLTWALAMIIKLLEMDQYQWRIIKP